MTTQIIIATTIGALGIGANAVIYQQRTGKRLLIWKLISDVLWAAHYLILGGFSAAAIACVGIVRECIFLNQRRAWARSKLWLLLFVALSIGSAALTWDSAISLLPATASVLSVFGFWRANPTLSKILAYPIAGCMLAYDVCILSYMGMINEIFTLTSTTVAVITLISASLKSKRKDAK